MTKDQSKVTRYFHEIGRMGNSLPEQVRPQVLEAFFDVFEEDLDILEDLRDR
ncbi:hypothetical protein [Paenibacillus sp. FSL R7-0128]|uniref:hypothetical protein n=1 Tax=Paenibacillus sp. FSL R7-0128 TaxID=2954529 RepID=UPI0030F623EF